MIKGIAVIKLGLHRLLIIPIFVFSLLLTSCEGMLKLHLVGCKHDPSQCSEEELKEIEKAKEAAKNSKKFSDPNCKDPDTSKVKEGVTFSKCDQSTGTGKMTIASSSGSGSSSSCSTDGQSSCLASGTYKVADTSTFSASDLRSGVTIAGVTGTQAAGSNLSKCRNGVNNAIYNFGAPAGSGANLTGGANAFHWWDTIDDWANNSTLTNMAGGSDAWDSTNFCNGSSLTNVTNTTASLTPTTGMNCSGAGCTGAETFSTIYLESLTGLYITNVLVEMDGFGCTGIAQCANWQEAVSGCANLSSGDGANKWRLPTQKELYALFNAGLFRVNASMFSSKLISFFWSATTNSSNTSQAWQANAEGTQSIPNNKTGGGGVICVRP